MSSVADLRVGGLGAVGDVLPDRSGEQCRILEDHSDTASQGIRGHLRDIVAGHHDGALGDRVEAEQQVHQGGLSAPGFAHKCHLLAGTDVEGDMVDDPIGAVVAEDGVVEGDHRDARLGLADGRRGGLRYVGRTGLHDGEVVLGPGHGALGDVDDVTHHLHRLASHRHELDEQDHVPDAEVSLGGSHEDDGVDTEEDDVEDHPPHGVHEVPVVGLLAGGVDGGVVVVVELFLLAGLGDVGLDDANLRDDLLEPPAGGVDVVVDDVLMGLPVA